MMYAVEFCTESLIPDEDFTLLFSKDGGYCIEYIERSVDQVG